MLTAAWKVIDIVECVGSLGLSVFEVNIYGASVPPVISRRFSRDCS